MSKFYRMSVRVEKVTTSYAKLVDHIVIPRNNNDFIISLTISWIH